MPNRLASQASPYLLQHANNPVDWWPWSSEAFEHARSRDVPIFLSIGYSTCYWCHVMERESFENVEIAAMINEAFVPIKLDREERPDLDELYMAATITMTGHGGWPMSVFLDPTTLKPFYCGTYFPAQPRPEYGRPSFPQLLNAMKMAWQTQRAGVRAQALEVASAVEEHLAKATPSAELGSAQVADAISGLMRTFDRTYGGFGAAPKFPQASYLELLLDVRSAAADDQTADAIDQSLRFTLTAMMIGGIHDHVGGGFHRYSVDAAWTVPHFEKMLYDNAQLASVYARAGAFYNDDEYRRTARHVLDYVLREMTDPATGLFYSAQDAEVDHREGLNYLWNPEQVAAAVDADDLALALDAYGLSSPANFKDPHHQPEPDEPKTWILRLKDRIDRIAPHEGLLPAMLVERQERINTALLRSRNQRKQPLTDDKCIAAWNGMMMRAFAIGAETLDQPRYLDAGRRCASSLLGSMWDGQTLLRSIRKGVAGPKGTLEDYAAVASGLLALHRAESIIDSGNDGSRLDQASAVLNALRSLFIGDDGRVYDTRAGETDLFVRSSSSHDGATPCGMSMYLNAQLDLFEATSEPIELERAVASLAAASGQIAASPTSTSNSTRALFRVLLAHEGGPEMIRQASPPAVEGSAKPAALRSASEVDPVEIYAAVERVTLNEEHPYASFSVVVKISQGWHVAAADAPDHPFKFFIVNGSGVAVYSDYPKANGALANPLGPGTIPVYVGTIEFTVALELDLETGRKGQPLIAISYQACSDSECLAPQSVELDIAIDA
jgi:uncharacterized protein YyaL (SSP411 family)